jgi:hypothetical protein
MAYVVRRRDGRFEIRESVQTDKGPRARTLANFAVLSEDVLRRAEGRSSRPFDRQAVRKSADRHDTPLDDVAPASPTAAGVPSRSTAHFVAASRRFVTAASEVPEHLRSDSGEALIELIGFAEEVARHQPRRRNEPLRFPSLSQMVSSKRAS